MNIEKIKPVEVNEHTYQMKVSKSTWKRLNAAAKDLGFKRFKHFLDKLFEEFLADWGG